MTSLLALGLILIQSHADVETPAARCEARYITQCRARWAKAAARPTEDVVRRELASVDHWDIVMAHCLDDQAKCESQCGGVVPNCAREIGGVVRSADRRAAEASST